MRRDVFNVKFIFCFVIMMFHQENLTPSTSITQIKNVKDKKYVAKKIMPIFGIFENAQRN